MSHTSQAMFRHRNLPHLLLQARETLLAGFRPILRQFGITEQQWRVMRTLNEGEPMEPNQLAEACLILSPSLTRMLSGMEDAGLVERTRSITDQRRQLVSLTPPARAIIAQMEPLIDARYQELEQRLGSERLTEVYRALDAMLASLALQPNPPANPPDTLAAPPPDRVDEAS